MQLLIDIIPNWFFSKAIIEESKLVDISYAHCHERTIINIASKKLRFSA